MDRTEVVCLCENYNLKGFFEDAFRACAPWVVLTAPEDVQNPAAIRHAFSFSPPQGGFTRYPNLALVSCAGAGVDAILNNPSLRSEIAVSRVIVEEQGQMIAAFALYHIVGFQREMLSYPPLQKAADWSPLNRTPPSAFPVGVLGFGRIGASLAHSLRGLGYPVTAYASRSRAEADGTKIVSGTEGLREIAQTCRAVVNSLPLTDETENILNAGFFREMREDSIFINLGRGQHLVESDLLAGLDQGRPAAAALDAFRDEPLPQEHPFWRHEKVFVTPHVAGNADVSAVAAFVAEGIRQFEQGGAPAGLVNRASGY